jgi:O-antigen/teichoic acid export membrane protein
VAWDKPWLLPRPSLIERSAVKQLLSSGSSFFLIQVAGVVVFSSDNLVVSHYLGAAEVTPYSVTWRLVGMAAALQYLVFPAPWPAYAEAHARQDFAWIRRTFSLMMKGTIALNLALPSSSFYLDAP